MFYIRVFYLKNEWIAHSLFFGERCKWIAQVAHQKWATMSDSLRSLRGNEQLWRNSSGRSPKMSKWVNRSFIWANCSFAHFWAKNERFAQKTDQQIPSPGRYCLTQCDNVTISLYLTKLLRHIELSISVIRHIKRNLPKLF